MNTNVIRELSAIADSLDAKGFSKEADVIDNIIKTAIGPTHSSGPEAAPAARIDPVPKPDPKKGAIQPPKDPFTYDWLEGEKAFVVRTAPEGKEFAIGAKIRENDGGWDILKSHIPESSSSAPDKSESLGWTPPGEVAEDTPTEQHPSTITTRPTYDYGQSFFR